MEGLSSLETTLPLLRAGLAVMVLIPRLCSPPGSVPTWLVRAGPSSHRTRYPMEFSALSQSKHVASAVLGPGSAFTCWPEY